MYRFTNGYLEYIVQDLFQEFLNSQEYHLKNKKTTDCSKLKVKISIEVKSKLYLLIIYIN